jgi:predicted glycoside hydrolase/deacetylase ChbG (UPF0249 family)
MHLIINADDFGMRPGIDRAVVELCGLDLVTSVSVLTEWPNAPFALSWLARHPEVGAGLHLDLDRFFLAAGFTRHPGGAFLVPDVFWNDAALLDEIGAAIAFQLDAFTAGGRIPDHVDGHHHVHLFPAVLARLVPEMDKRGIRAIRFAPSFYRLFPGMPAAIALLERHGIQYPEKFIEGPVLPSPGEACCAEMMVHVSEDVPEEECWRIRERHALLDPQFRAVLESGRFKTGGFSRVAGACQPVGG